MGKTGGESPVDKRNAETLTWECVDFSGLEKNGKDRAREYFQEGESSGLYGLT